MRPAEGDAGNSRGRVIPYPAQSGKPFIGAGKYAIELRLNLSRGCMQVARPRVVTEALPGAHHQVFRRFGQRFYGGEAAYERIVVAKALSYLGLLKDYLRKPDEIRVPR